MSPSAKRCYCVPYAVNSRFWGRETALHRVKNALDPNKGHSGPRTFGLWGMGGVGKTQIALHYAADSRENYDSKLWVSADNTVRMSQSFGEIALRLGLVVSGEENEDAMSAMMKVKQWLIETSERSVSCKLTQLNMWRSTVAFDLR